MEKQALKELFFIGSDEEVNAFLESIKPRCIKVPTDNRYMTINTQYGVEKVVYNSDHDSFIDQHMNEYKIDRFSETLEPIDSFVEVDIHRAQRKRPEGARYSIRTELISQAALDSELYLVEDCMWGEGNYLYRDSPGTRKLFVAPNMWKWYDTHDAIGRDDFVMAKTFFDEEGNFYDYPVNGKEFKTLDYMTGEVHYIDADGEYRIARVFESELNDFHFEECSYCGDWWRRGDLDVHKRCDFCNQVNIYPYHGWDGRINFLKSDEDDEDEKVYFGTEIETVGDTSNKACLKGYQHIFHLEEDGSIYPEGFEIISQPMTWNYILEHEQDFDDMFRDLENSGQEAEETDCCGLHIHVSRAAFKSDRAVQRAIAIVHRLDTEFMEFSRRENYEYCEFHHLKRNFSWLDVDSIPHSCHDCAINTGNVGSLDKNTVEFRFFKSTLDIDTYLAAIELVKSIVEMANSEQMIVTFRMLMNGRSYVTKYVNYKTRAGARYHLDSYSCDFTYACMREFMTEYANTGNPYQVLKDFTELLAKGRDVIVETTETGYSVRNPLAITETPPEIAGASESEVA